MLLLMHTWRCKHYMYTCRVEFFVAGVQGRDARIRALQVDLEKLTEASTPSESPERSSRTGRLTGRLSGLPSVWRSTASYTQRTSGAASSEVASVSTSTRSPAAALSGAHHSFMMFGRL